MWGVVVCCGVSLWKRTSNAMTRSGVARLLCLATLGGARGAPAGDLVAALPGLAALSSTLYSGYLNAGLGQHLHYVYSEAIAVDPTTAKLVLWFNGGPVRFLPPGCRL